MTEQTTAPLRAVPYAAARRPGVTAVTRLLPHPDAMNGAERPGLQGTLALSQSPRTSRPAADGRVRPDLRLVDGGQARTRAWTVRFFQVLVEVLGGDRSPHQLLRSCSHEVYVDLARRSEVLNRVAGPSQRRLRAQVRSVHVCQPSPLVAEVSARVEQGGRSRAVAARVELLEGRWQCTALELG